MKKRFCIRIMICLAAACLIISCADTRAFTGEFKWKELKTAKAPGPDRGKDAMVFDEERGVYVLTCKTTAGFETWEFDGTGWSMKYQGKQPFSDNPSRRCWMRGYGAEDELLYYDAKMESVRMAATRSGYKLISPPAEKPKLEYIDVELRLEWGNASLIFKNNASDEIKNKIRAELRKQYPPDSAWENKSVLNAGSGFSGPCLINADKCESIYEWNDNISVIEWTGSEWVPVAEKEFKRTISIHGEGEPFSYIEPFWDYRRNILVFPARDRIFEFDGDEWNAVQVKTTIPESFNCIFDPESGNILFSWTANYRFVAQESIEDMITTFVKDRNPVNFEYDGKVLCKSDKSVYDLIAKLPNRKADLCYDYGRKRIVSYSGVFWGDG